MAYRDENLMNGPNKAPEDPYKGAYGTSDRQDYVAKVQELDGVGVFDTRTPMERFGGEEDEPRSDAAVHPFERP